MGTSGCTSQCQISLQYTPNLGFFNWVESADFLHHEEDFLSLIMRDIYVILKDSLLVSSAAHPK